MSTLYDLDQRIAKSEDRHVAQITRLRSLIGRGESITEAMRVLVEIEDDLVILNDQRITLLLPELTS